MKATHVLMVVFSLALVAVSGIKAQQQAPGSGGAPQTLVQKLQGVEAVELLFDDRLSGYAVRLLTRQEARNLAIQPAQDDAERARQEARRIAQQFYAGTIDGVVPVLEGKPAQASPCRSPRHRNSDAVGRSS